MSDVSPQPARDRRPSAGLLGLAVLELVLAGLARAGSAPGGFCPIDTGVFGCAGVQRLRVSQLGPLAIGDLAILGASLAVGVAALFLWRGVQRPWARDGAFALAACAGVALGVQPLAWLASSLLCPLCLAVAGCAVAVAVCAAWLAAREADVSARGPLVAGLLALALTAGLATWRGLDLQQADAARTQAALAAGGERGPRLVMVSKDGCPFCHAALADVWGDPALVELLGQTRGLEEVGLDHPLAEGVRGVPLLRALGEDGQDLVEPLEGVPALQGGYDWLRAAIAAGGP